jgi:hypothetical protein
MGIDGTLALGILRVVLTTGRNDIGIVVVSEFGIEIVAVVTTCGGVVVGADICGDFDGIWG